MKIAFFNLNCILRDRLLSRKIVTVYGGLCPAVTPVCSPPLLRKGLYMNLLTECTPACSSPPGPPLHSFPFLLLILITLPESAAQILNVNRPRLGSARRRFLSRRDFLDLQLYLDFFFFFSPPCSAFSPYSERFRGGGAGVCSVFDKRRRVFFLPPKLTLRRLNRQTSATLHDRDAFAV